MYLMIKSPEDIDISISVKTAQQYRAVIIEPNTAGFDLKKIFLPG